MTRSPGDLRPATIVGPGARIQRELDERGWTQRDLAEILGRPTQAINEIVKGTKQVTPDTAIQLGQALGPSAEFWLQLETAYRLRLAEAQNNQADDVTRRRRLYELAPVAELQRRGWIPTTRSDAQLEQGLCKYFEIADPREPPRLPVASLRMTDGRTAEDRSRDSWIKRAEWLARATAAPRYRHGAFVKAVTEVFRLAIAPEQVSAIPETLRDIGIRLVIVPHLPKTYLDGAAFWLDGSPVVALSLRYDRLDYLWFTLSHELAHIYDQERSGVVDDERDAARGSRTEQAADNRAQDWLIDPERLAEFKRSFATQPTRDQVERFAQELGRHPSIVVGRLQHEGVLSYAQLRSLHVPVRASLAGWFDRVPVH